MDRGFDAARRPGTDETLSVMGRPQRNPSIARDGKAVVGCRFALHYEASAASTCSALHRHRPRLVLRPAGSPGDNSPIASMRCTALSWMYAPSGIGRGSAAGM